MATLGSLVVNIGANLKPLQEGLSKSSKMVGGAAKSIGKGLALGAAGGALVLGTAIGGIGVSAFSTATDIDAATARIQSALGVTAEQASQLGEIGQDVFENNFTGSIGEATAAVGLTAQQLKNITFEELQGATENALRLSDAFDTDLNQTLNASNVLMTQFGLNQQESFDFLSSGFQQGLDSSGDFLDSITEYGNLFGQAGASAGQFFSLMETGLQGGVLGTDRAADLFKEFSIRIVEGSDSQLAALQALGVDSNALFAGMSSGSITTIQAFEAVQAALNQVSDPIARNAIGVELMGTQFEDLGANAVAGISTATTSMEDLAGSTETLDAQYDTISAKVETLGRKMSTALAPVGEVLVTMVEQALPAVESFVSFFSETGVPAITSFATSFSDAFAGIMSSEGEGGIATELSTLKAVWDRELGQIAESESLTKISDAFGRIKSALNIGDGPTGLEMLQTGLQNLTSLVDGADSALNTVATVMERTAAATESAATFITNFSNGLGTIKMPSALQAMIDKFNEMKSAIPAWLIPGSPPPLFWALKDINKAAGEAPNISQAYGFNQAPELNGLARAGQNETAQASTGSERPTIINLILDGQIIETIVSDRQGVKRQNDMAMGGMTAL